MDENELHKKTQRIAEAFYGASSDPNQMPANQASRDKLRALHPQTVLFKTVENEPVSWVVVIPTTKLLGQKFVHGEISERELFEQSVPQEQYEALYFCSVFTVREHQRRGYATELLKQALASIPLVPNPYYFCWLYSRQGKALYSALTKRFSSSIHLRTSP